MSDYIKISIENSFSSHPKAIYWSKKNNEDPSQVSRWSKKKYLFDCPDCKHEFEKALCKISMTSSCPYCSKHKLCDDILCIMCYQNSFASQFKSIFWSKKNDLSPRQVFKSSGKKYWFDCCDCLHSFESALNHIIRGKFCPYCANQKLCTEANCYTCFEKSFASCPMSFCWSNKNLLVPREVFKHSHTKYKLDCCVCFHTFESKLHNFNNTYSCSYCDGYEFCEEEDCDTCFNKSFASHPMSQYWSKENNISPRMVSKSTHKKYKFDCPACNNIYIAGLNNISKGHWCPCTKNKTETKLYEFLTENYAEKIIHQAKFEWCRNELYLPFDFFIKRFKLIIELDGKQHFVQVGKWDSPKKIQERDVHKMKLANQHGYSVIRILQSDVWKNKHHWQLNLMDAIQKYPTPINIYIGKIYASYPCYQPSY
jgi:very-short-patch-repair endonuclease